MGEKDGAQGDEPRKWGQRGPVEEREDLAEWKPGGGATKRRRDSEW